jgi:hypothetical protein
MSIVGDDVEPQLELDVMMSTVMDVMRPSGSESEADLLVDIL